ncbi:MAG TPA: HlyD family efflux transporter periplasmic adaptor subunit [Desulfitobacteriaceae bacterium]|nr:HlyD family efflux transporter periplasmic adaptor subunit [Desulfitobacteriaceae bacterium]
MRGKKQQYKVVLWSLAIAAVLGGLGFWFAHDTIISKGLAIDYAQSGVIKHEIKVTATFVNQEFLIYSATGGKVQFLGVDGQRFRRGEIVAKIQSDNPADLTAPEGGLLFRQVDGYETFLTAESLRSSDLAELLALKATAQETDSVLAGGAVGKIVNNLVPTEAFVAMTSLENMAVDKKMSFTVADQVQSAKVILLSESPLGVIVQFSRFVDSSVEKRHQEIIWNSRPPVSGIIIPLSSLWLQGEEQGVYVIAEGVVRYHKVKILDQSETQVCVEGLPSGMPVITNPRKGIDGLAVAKKQ